MGIKSRAGSNPAPNIMNKMVIFLCIFGIGLLSFYELVIARNLSETVEVTIQFPRVANEYEADSLIVSYIITDWPVSDFSKWSLATAIADTIFVHNVTSVGDGRRNVCVQTQYKLKPKLSMCVDCEPVSIAIKLCSPVDSTTTTLEIVDCPKPNQNIKSELVCKEYEI